jgi:hypothetical protein
MAARSLGRCNRPAWHRAVQRPVHRRQQSFGSARNIEASLGYGNKRPNGVFAGVRWVPLAMPALAFVAEYDANDYKQGFRAAAPTPASAKKAPRSASNTAGAG